MPWNIVCGGSVLSIDAYAAGFSLSGSWDITLAQDAGDCDGANVIVTTGFFSDVPFCPGA